MNQQNRNRRGRAAGAPKRAPGRAECPPLETEQRWLVEHIIRANGIDWDQPRVLLHECGPAGIEASADFAAIRQRTPEIC